MNRIVTTALAAGTAITAALSLGTGPAGAATTTKKVYYILPNSTTVRFERRDAPLYVKYMKEIMPSAKVIVQNGEGDPTRQQRVVEDAISNGANLIVLIATDPHLAAGELKDAANAHVPVVLYSHNALGGPAKAIVLFVAKAVGVAQGKRAAELIKKMDKAVVHIARVKGQQGEYGTMQYEKGQNHYLEPLIKSGKVKVVCSQYTQNWNPTLAQSFAEDCLTRTGGKVDMFLGMNDGTSGGAVAALISQGYKPGQIKVAGGQDATIEGVQYIAEGWQDDTVFKDLRVMAKATAEVSAAILKDKPLPQKLVNGTMDNHYGKIPAVFLPVQMMTKNNLSLVVDNGTYTWAQICKHAKDTKVCRGHM